MVVQLELPPSVLLQILRLECTADQQWAMIPIAYLEFQMTNTRCKASRLAKESGGEMEEIGRAHV